MESRSEPVLRLRGRRCKGELHDCQDCKVRLVPENWSPSMRGETGQRQRYICRACWTARQRGYAAKKAPDQLRAERNARRLKRQSEWDETRREVERRRRYGSWLRRQYGISIEQFDAMYELQGGKCGICADRQPRGRGGFHVDHCHATGAIRGLLCATCNMLLGMAEDSIDRLRSAMDYLKNAQRADHKPEARAALGGKAF